MSGNDYQAVPEGFLNVLGADQDQWARIQVVIFTNEVFVTMQLQHFVPLCNALAICTCSYAQLTYALFQSGYRVVCESTYSPCK